jgi:hypothetical protein
MSTYHSAHPYRCASGWTGLLLWSVFHLSTGPACAGSTGLLEVPPIPSRAHVQAQNHSAAYRPVLAAEWWQQAYNQLETALGNRERMIQFGAVGMCLALLVIWYRK